MLGSYLLHFADGFKCLVIFADHFTGGKFEHAHLASADTHRGKLLVVGRECNARWIRLALLVGEGDGSVLQQHLLSMHKLTFLNSYKSVADLYSKSMDLGSSVGAVGSQYSTMPPTSAEITQSYTGLYWQMIYHAVGGYKCCIVVGLP